MGKYTEIGDYLRAIGQADVQVNASNLFVSFNGHEKTIDYLKELLQPEIYLYRVIYEITRDPDLYAYEEQLVNCLELAQGFFIRHADTSLMVHKNLMIEYKGKPVDYMELHEQVRICIAEFVAEQHSSFLRVSSRLGSRRQRNRK